MTFVHNYCWFFLLNLETIILLLICSDFYLQSSLRISANGIGAVSGRLLLGKAEVIPPSELVDTTGAGDAFIGAVLYGLYILYGFYLCALFLSPREGSGG